VVPKSTFSTSTSGENTRAKPSSTSATCVRKSAIARKMFSLAASWTPTTFTTARKATTATPTTMSAGDSTSGSQMMPR
jgi:hypothetical protein